MRSEVRRNCSQNVSCERIIKKYSPNQKSQEPDSFTTKFCHTFKEELMEILLKLFYKIEIKGTLPDSFYEATITLIPKLYTDHFSYEHRYKKLNKILANQIQE